MRVQTVYGKTVIVVKRRSYGYRRNQEKVETVTDLHPGHHQVLILEGRMTLKKEFARRLPEFFESKIVDFAAFLGETRKRMPVKKEEEMEARWKRVKAMAPSHRKERRNHQTLSHPQAGKRGGRGPATARRTVQNPDPAQLRPSAGPFDSQLRHYNRRNLAPLLLAKTFACLSQGKKPKGKGNSESRTSPDLNESEIAYHWHAERYFSCDIGRAHLQCAHIPDP
jgi:hypothetical protein